LLVGPKLLRSFQIALKILVAILVNHTSVKTRQEAEHFCCIFVNNSLTFVGGSYFIDVLISVGGVATEEMEK
jgi:hypothetical protein